MSEDSSNQEEKIQQLEVELSRERENFARDQAIERLRSEVLAMRDASGLRDVALLLYLQGLEFGIDMSAMGFFFVNEETQQVVWYAALENPKKHGITWKSGFEEYNEEIGVMALELPLDDSWDEDVERWRASKVETVVRTAEENAAAMKDFYDTCGLSSPMPFSSEE